MPFLYALTLLLFALVQPDSPSPPAEREVASEDEQEKAAPPSAEPMPRWEKERWKN